MISNVFKTVRHSLLCIFVQGYREEYERTEMVEEFTKYKCMCEANIKGGMNISGDCREHNTTWI